MNGDQSSAVTRRISYIDAIAEAHLEEMLRDERVILIGEDVSLYAAGKVLDKIDPDRILSAPISENSFTGMGVGAALTGLRPIIDLTVASFAYLASDQIINQASKLRYMTGGQVNVPIVIRSTSFHNTGVAAQHSDRPYPFFMNCPGLKIVVPASPADAKGLLKSAIRDDDPVLIFEDVNLWAKKGEVPSDPDFLVPIGKADVKRYGTDVTVVSIGSCILDALASADALAKEGVSVEVVDIRTLIPLDKDAVLESVSKTRRLVIVDAAHRTASAASHIASVVCEEGFELLSRPIKFVTTPDVHIPFSPSLEKLLYPSATRISVAVKSII